ncbi:YeaC family protein [Edwardsiella ictaluri]|uniref:YeaC family protein n=1 Tax=Edwardsiella ictaluri TaxID=67780 RepID=UPI0037832C80
MDIERLISIMNEDVYQRLATAVELGKWPDGSRLSESQRGEALQMVMLYQSRHNHQAAHLTVNTRGEIEMKSKQALKALFVAPLAK